MVQKKQTATTKQPTTVHLPCEHGSVQVSSRQGRHAHRGRIHVCPKCGMKYEIQFNTSGPHGVKMRSIK